MKKIAIYAHYDKKNIIDDYVLYSISELKKICEEIIFVSCSNLSKEELDKLDCIKIVEPHSEYDFGSYKRGFLYAKSHKMLENCSELVFMNDSCYGPFKPLDKIFNLMQENSCDFWGLTKNKYAFKIIKNRTKDCYIPHIQSYFFVLRPQVFNSKVFENFISSVKHEDNKNTVIEKYEIGLTPELESAGFVCDYAIKDFYKYNNPTVYKWRKLYEKSDFPFIKCSLLRLHNTLHTTVEGWKELLPKEYIDMIEKNLSYTRRINPMKHLAPRRLKEAIFNHLPNKKMKARMVSRMLLKSVFSFLTD
jgi:lipopolysaccharide biosynthesis protein